MSDVLPFVKHPFTMNFNVGELFTCLVCGHWLYENETEWGDYFSSDSDPFGGPTHGTEPIKFCPHCGARIVTLDEWADIYPQDRGKSLVEIEERFRERRESGRP